jgi:hypothetical protein
VRDTTAGVAYGMLDDLVQAAIDLLHIQFAHRGET